MEDWGIGGWRERGNDVCSFHGVAITILKKLRSGSAWDFIVPFWFNGLFR